MDSKSNKKNVYLVRLSAIGDVVMSAHAINWLVNKGFNPVLITAKANEAIATCIKGLKFLILWDVKGSEPLQYYMREDTTQAFVPIPLDSKMFPTPQLFIDLQVTSRSRFLIKTLHRNIKLPEIASVPKYTLFRICSVIRARLSCTQKPRKPKNYSRGKILETHQKVLKKTTCLSNPNEVLSNTLETPTTPFKPLLKVPQPLPIAVHSLGTYVCLCPSASSFEKRWPKENFRQLMGLILTKTQFNIVLCGGEDVVDVGQYLEFPKSNRIVNGIGKWNLMETLSVLESAHYAVVNDSFASHACDGFGTPASVLFGPTTPLFGFAPKNDFITIHYLNLSCSPCSRHGQAPCRFKNLACLRSISPEAVFDSLLANHKTT